MDRILQEQIDTIRQTFGYVEQFRDKIFVIKIDSELLNDTYFSIFIKDVILLHKAGIKIVLIPGTQQRIDEVLHSFNVDFERVNGMRITSNDAIPFVKMAAFDVSNKLMTQLAEHSTNGVIGNWVRARGIGVRDGIDYKATGTVDKVDANSIKNILSQGMIPIFPNIGWSLRGKPYNISSNELALKISTALTAEKLFFITVNKGVSIDNGEILSQLTVKEAKSLLRSHSDISGKEFLKLGCSAIDEGVSRVHIIDGKINGVILKEIFSNIGLGTMIYTGNFDNIRVANHNDIPDILRITDELVEKGILIYRSYQDIEKCISEYVLYEVDNTIHGCGALKGYSDNSAEIYSIAVDSSYSSKGVGKKIISYLVNKALKEKFNKLFLLTTQTTDWFIDRGFVEAQIEDLPPEKREKYNYKRMSRVLSLDLTNPEQYNLLLNS